MHRKISEADLQAFVDGELDADRVAEIEQYLAAHPQLAERVSDYIEQSRAIRDAVTRDAWTPTVLTMMLVERLARRLRWLRLRSYLGGGALAAAAVAVGWFGHSMAINPGGELAPSHPAFVEEAAEAHATVEALALALNEATDLTASQAADILHSIAGEQVSLDAIADQWPITGALVVPWDDGTAVELIHITPQGEVVSLFVAVPDHPGDVRPTSTRMDTVNMAYWQSNRIAFALSGDLPERELLEIAHRLSSSRL